jgi:non-homologous end joining protein Ku
VCEIITPPPVIDLMAALKRSLAQETPAISGTTAKKSEPGPQPIGASDHCFYR